MFKKFKNKEKIELNDDELKMILYALNDFRTDLLNEGRYVDAIDEILVKLKSKMKVTKRELAVIINGLDFKRKALESEEQDTYNISVLLMRILDVSEKMK